MAPGLHRSPSYRDTFAFILKWLPLWSCRFVLSLYPELSHVTGFGEGVLSSTKQAEAYDALVYQDAPLSLCHCHENMPGPARWTKRPKETTPPQPKLLSELTTC